MSGPLIVTAELGKEDFQRLDALRRLYFPPERNQLSAHLTLFHALPPSCEAEVRQLLGALAAELPPPRALISSVMSLGRGVAMRIASDDLQAIREEVARSMHGLLSAQDAGGWVPHVTIQNKVASSTARALKAKLEEGFSPTPLKIGGLGLYRYLGGSWERLQLYPFRGG